MMSSENRNYNLPDKGESDWHELLNENFKNIDLDIDELFETKLDRDVLSAIENQLYVETSQVGVRVPRDYDTIQAAVDAAPRYSAELYHISIDDGTYDEDVVIGPYTNIGSRPGSLSIEGNASNPSNCQVGSFMVVGSSGNVASPHINGFTLTRDSPHFTVTSSEAAIFVVGSQETALHNLRFNPEYSGNIPTGIECYGGANVDIRNVDIDNTDEGIKAKRESIVLTRDCTGRASDYAYFATEASQIVYASNDATGESGVKRLDVGSFAATSNMHMFRDLNPRDLRIDDDPVRYGTLVGEEEPSSSSSSVTVEFDGLDDDARYLIDYAGSQQGTDGDVLLRINGDTRSNYDYFDESGDSSTGNSGIPLMTPSNSWCGFGGIVHLVPRNQSVGVHHDFQAVQVNRTESYADCGNYDGSSSLSSIQLVFPSWSGDGDDHVRCWKLNQPGYFGPGLMANESWDRS